MLAGVHIGQSDVGIAQTPDPSDHLASLLLHHIDDLLSHVRPLLHEKDLSITPGKRLSPTVTACAIKARGNDVSQSLFNI